MRLNPHNVTCNLKYITNIDYMYLYQSSQYKNSSNTMEKIRSNSWENLTQYYLLTCRIVVNVKVWEIGRGKQAAGQSRAPGWVMWTKCLPCDSVQPMEAALRNSNEIICKHRKLRLQVPGKVFRESGPSIHLSSWNFTGTLPVSQWSALSTLGWKVKVTMHRLGKTVSCA